MSDASWTLRLPVGTQEHDANARRWIEMLRSDPHVQIVSVYTGVNPLHILVSAMAVGPTKPLMEVYILFKPGFDRPRDPELDSLVRYLHYAPHFTHEPTMTRSTTWQWRLLHDNPL